MAGLGILKKAFPFIEAAASAGGPLAVMAAQAVGKAIGADKPVDPTPEGIAKAIQDAGFTPDQRAALMQHEADLKQELDKLGYQTLDDLTKLDNDDRANARARQIALKDITPTVMAILITAGFFGSLWWVFVYGVRAEVHDLAMTMLGVLGTAWLGVTTYYFGSSAGSAKKTELLAQQGQQQNQ